MVYGILLAGAVQLIGERYDRTVLKQAEEYLECDLSHLNLFEVYDDRLMVGLSEGRISLARPSLRSLGMNELLIRNPSASCLRRNSRRVEMTC